MKLTQILSEGNEIVGRKATAPTVDPRKALGRVASADVTATRSADVQLPDQARSRLADFFAASPVEPEQADAQYEPQGEISYDNVPSVLQNAMSVAGVAHPEWHMIGNLPGYMSGPIRQLGKELFAQYTSTPVENIQMVASLGGHGPNTPREVNAVAQWIVSTGEKVTEGKVDIDAMNYQAFVQIFDVEDIEVMLVKDEYGQYIYAWPASDSKM